MGLEVSQNRSETLKDPRFSNYIAAISIFSTTGMKDSTHSSHTILLFDLTNHLSVLDGDIPRIKEKS